MHKTACLLLLCSAVYGADMKFDPSQGWKSLIYLDLNGWRPLDPAKPNDWLLAQNVAIDPANPKLLTITPLPPRSSGILINGKMGKTVNIVSTNTYGDMEAFIDFMIPQGSNSGVYFQGLYEIQIFDSYGKKDLAYNDCGGVYARYISNQSVGGAAPRVNASRAPGEWQSFQVWFRAPKFDAQGKKIRNASFEKIIHNGVTIHENVEVEGPTRASMTTPEAPTGPLMLQGDHGPVAFRHIYVRPR